jgi:hypothetical protein
VTAKIILDSQLLELLTRAENLVVFVNNDVLHCCSSTREEKLCPSANFCQVIHLPLFKYEQNSHEILFLQTFANTYKFDNLHLTWESHFMGVSYFTQIKTQKL